MKARIRKTGEIVDVIYYNHFSTIRSSQDFVSYIDSNGVEHDRESLNYYWDFEPIDNAENDVHWQDVRERAAIAAMQGILSNSHMILSIDETVNFAIECTDRLIKKLNK